MAIFSDDNNKNLKINIEKNPNIKTESIEYDKTFENSIRPKDFESYIGQGQLKETLKITLEAAKLRGKPLDHMLFYGPPGLGKTTIAGVIATQMNVEIKITSAPASGTGNDGIFGYSQFGSMYTDVVTDLSESEAKSQWGDYFNYYNSELDTCYHLIGDYNAGNAYITGSSEDISGVVTLPKYAMSIGNGAFQGRTNITEVTTISLYESILIKVGDNAFNGCTGLSKVTLPESVEVIGASAFAGTTSLSEINTSTCKISQVYENAFEGSGLGNIMFNDSLQTIKTAAFKNSKLGRIEQIDNITIINASVFEGCTYLFSVPFDNILTIGNSAFKGCTALGNFSYNKVTSIGSSAFEGCTGMTYITLGTSLKTIGANAFKGCSNLVEIELLGDKLTTIGDSAFYGCSSMTSFTVTEAVTSLDGAFTGAYFSSVTFKNATIGTQTFKEFAGTTLSLNLANSTITTFTDGLFEGAKITSFTIPTQITRLEGSVFKSCTKLTSLYIPNSVATITIVTTNQGLVYGCSAQNLTVYAEATTEPSGWDNDWRLMSSNNTLVGVQWGAYTS